MLALVIAARCAPAIAQGRSTTVEQRSKPGGPSVRTDVAPARAEPEPRGTLVARGAVEAATYIDVRCAVSGGSTVVSVVPQFSQVTKGQLVCELDSTELKRGLLRHVAAEKQARVAYEQARSAARSKADEAAKRLAWETIKAEGNSLWKQFRACKVVAPVDGPVRLDFDREPPHGLLGPGAKLREGQVLFTVGDVRELVMNVKVKEKDVDRLKVGQRARISIEALPEVLLTGSISSIAVLPDPSSRFERFNYYTTRVTLDSRPRSLEAGMLATVTISLTENP